jgi:hypothetical protein
MKKISKTTKRIIIERINFIKVAPIDIGATAEILNSNFK